MLKNVESYAGASVCAWLVTHACADSAWLMGQRGGSPSEGAISPRPLRLLRKAYIFD